MALESPAAWNRYAAGDPRGAMPAIRDVHYGPDIPDESELRLLGNLRDKRVLELGCGGGQCLVALAAQGAHAIGLDYSSEQLAATKRLSEREGVRVEVHQGDLADLAFMRAESVDLAFSAYGLGLVEDLNRLFRQVHRVLKQGAPLVFSMTHPCWHVVDGDPGQSMVVRRSYFDRHGRPGGTGAGFHHTFGDLFAGLSRTKFRVDTLLEPEPRAEGPRSAYWQEGFRFLPSTLIVRARKEGI